MHSGTRADRTAWLRRGALPTARAGRSATAAPTRTMPTSATTAAHRERPPPPDGEAEGRHGQPAEQRGDRDRRLLHGEGQALAAHVHDAGDVEVGRRLRQAVGQATGGQHRQQESVGPSEDGDGRQHQRRQQGRGLHRPDRAQPLGQATEAERAEGRGAEERRRREAERGRAERQLLADLHRQRPDEEHRQDGRRHHQAGGDQRSGDREVARCARSAQGLMTTTRELGHLPDGVGRALPGVAAVAHAAVGHLVGPPRRHLVDEHAAEVERAGGAERRGQSRR